MISDVILGSKNYLYLIKVKGQEVYKIGISKSPVGRLSSLQTGCPYRLYLVYCLRVDDAERLEAELHEHFQAKRLFGEWFELSDEDVHKVICLMRLAHTNCLDNIFWAEKEKEDREGSDKNVCPGCGGVLRDKGLATRKTHQGQRKFVCTNKIHVKSLGPKTFYLATENIGK